MIKKNSVILSLLLLFFSVTIYYLSVDIKYSDTSFFDMQPGPDAVEYMTLTKNIATRKCACIEIAELQLPSRYPIGFSLVGALAYQILDCLNQNTTKALFLTNQFLGLLTILITFIFYYIGTKKYLIVFPLLLIVSWPSFVLLSRSSISETSGGFLVLLASLLFVNGIKGKRFQIYLSAGLFGIVTLFKLQYLPLFIAFPIYLLSKQITKKEFLLCCLSFGIGLLPLSAYQLLTFNSLFFNGYDYWVPGSVGFSLEWFSQNSIVWIKELFLHEQRYSVSNIFGQGVYYRPTLILLIPLVTFYLLRVSYLRPLIIALILNFLLLVSYRFGWDLRFFYHLVLPVLALSGVAFYYIKSITNKSVFIVLFILSFIGLPDYTNIAQARSWIGLLNHFDYKHSTPSNYRLIKRFHRKVPRYQAVITPLDFIYMKTFLNNSAIVIPYSSQNSYRHSKVFKFSDQDITDRVQKYLTKDTYYLSTINSEVKTPNNILLEQLLKENSCEFRSIIRHKKFVIKKLQCTKRL